jgi:hypothetical protein
MKISVLLPTRDRLELLRHAVDSVTRLEDDDWEIVVSDNCSSGDVEGYVGSLQDSRIRYVRTPRLFSITENWNNALAHSRGDYVVMLGDDDALLGSYFIRTRELIAEFDRPQVIYHNALGYAYPGVIPGEAHGLLRSEGYAPFIREATGPARLPCDRAREIARGVADFRLSYGFNMQFVTVARDAIEELTRDGEFFHSPFPDYYAMNHLFACAHSIVVEPRPLVVIGISPRSYGFYFYNHRESEGRSLLEGKAHPDEQQAGQPPLLPGLNINNGWLRATEELYEQLGSPADFRPNYRRYRALQILHVYTGSLLQSTVPAEQLEELKRLMSGPEHVLYGALFAVLSTVARLLPKRARPHLPRLTTLLARQLPWWDPVPAASRFCDISDVVERVVGADDVTRWQQQRGSHLRGAILARIFP